MNLELPGSKYVVGDGPDLEPLRRRYPNVIFAGQKTGQELTAHIAAADVFVFPSLTDTFGLVLLEAMSCGVPVAACPAPVRSMWCWRARLACWITIFVRPSSAR